MARQRSTNKQFVHSTQPLRHHEASKKSMRSVSAKNLKLDNSISHQLSRVVRIDFFQQTGSCFHCFSWNSINLINICVRNVSLGVSVRGDRGASLAAGALRPGRLGRRGHTGRRGMPPRRGRSWFFHPRVRGREARLKVIHYVLLPILRNVSFFARRDRGAI